MASMATTTHQQQAVPSFASSDARWDAVRRRDRAADGAFYYSVLTTGVYCRPNCAARLPRRANVALPCHLRGGRGGGLPAVQALPAERGAAGRTARLRGGAGLSPDRGGGRGAEPRRARQGRRHEPLSLSPGVQGGHRRDAQSLCRCAAREARAGRADAARHGHRGDLRRRFQFQRTLLRRFVRSSRHDAERISRRRRRRVDPLRGRRMLARLDPGGGDRQGDLRDPVRRRSGRAGARSSGPLPEGAAGRRR